MSLVLKKPFVKRDVQYIRVCRGRVVRVKQGCYPINLNKVHAEGGLYSDRGNLRTNERPTARRLGLVPNENSFIQFQMHSNINNKEAKYYNNASLLKIDYVYLYKKYLN